MDLYKFMFINETLLVSFSFVVYTFLFCHLILVSRITQRTLQCIICHFKIAICYCCNKYDKFVCFLFFFFLAYLDCLILFSSFVLQALKLGFSLRETFILAPSSQLCYCPLDQFTFLWHMTDSLKDKRLLG